MMMEQIANRYEILSLIGQGGMADVYKAKDTILNRIVAIKVLRDKLSGDAMALVRFQREASAASRLSHPNVVDIMLVNMKVCTILSWNIFVVEL